MTLKRQAPAKLGKERFHGGDDEGGVTFPSTQVLFESIRTKLSSVDTQVRHMRRMSEIVEIILRIEMNE